MKLPNGVRIFPYRKHVIRMRKLHTAINAEVIAPNSKLITTLYLDGASPTKIVRRIKQAVARMERKGQF